MLTGSTSATPRPRPPAAHKRRASSHLNANKASSPPPPYAPSLSFSMSTLEHPASPRPHNTSADLSWFNDSSGRSELSQLFHKADQLVKDRGERAAQSPAATLYKELYSSNLALRSKHQDLLSRIPSASPIASPLQSPTISSPRFFTSDHLQVGERGSINRRRRVSVSPSDLNLLSDQNAELLQKIEEIEAENTHVESEGRRKIEKLDEEIHLLREELERTHAKSEEMEQRALRGERELQRIERDDRIKDLRLSSSLKRDSSVSSDLKDFAPESELTSSIRSRIRKESATGSSQLTLCDLGPIPPALGSSFPPSRSLNSKLAAPLANMLEPHIDGLPGETSNIDNLIAQLMLKIEELEQTNSVILSQQSEAASQLRSVQQETENISRAYEYLDTDDLEFVADEGFFEDNSGSDGGVDPEVQTISFNSFRRSLDASKMRDTLAEEFNSGIANARQSTVRSMSHGSRASMHAPRPSKARRSLAGLFESSSSSSHIGSLRQEFFFPAHPMDTSSSNADMYPENPPSPALSVLSITSNPSLAQLNPHSATTLDAELGKRWTPNEGRHHHLHSSSIYDMLSPTPSRSSSPTKSSQPLPYPPHMHTRTRSSTPRTPSPVRKLRISLEPPTPEQAQLTKFDGKKSLRSGRLSQTVRTRADRWDIQRFPDSPSKHAEPVPPLTLTRALDHVVETFTKVNPTELASNDASGPGAADAADRRRDRVASLMLEIWLWLQFIVVIFVFLFALAKRGPRSVLKDKQS